MVPAGQVDKPTRRARRDRRSIVRRLAGLVPLALVSLVLAGCGDVFDDHPQDTFGTSGTHAQDIERLIIPIFGIAGFVFVFVLGGCLFVALKFRARDDADFDDMPEQIHGHFKAEIGWTIVPAVVLMVVAVFTVVGVFKLNETPPDDAVRVEVIGHQWWWEYRYDLDNDGEFDEVVTANDLVMPVGREVALTVTSRDVIHSFWVPQLNGKRDAVPNRAHPWKLQSDELGEFVGQCTEFCGLSHAEMRIKAVVVSEADFAEWTERMQRPAQAYAEDDTSPEAEGYRVFMGQLCSSCHLVDGVNNENFVQDAESGRIADPELQVSGHAPQLTHLFGRTTFAGAMFDLRHDTPECREAGLFWADDPDTFEKCFNRPKLEAWLRDPPAEKAMAPDGVEGRTYVRGMPDLDLSDEQIDQLVAYLSTLK